MLDGYKSLGESGTFATRFTLDTLINELLASEAASAVLQRHIPSLFENTLMLEKVKSVPLRQVGSISLPAFEPKHMQAIAAELAELRS